MASSNDSNSPPDSKFGGVSTPSVRPTPASGPNYGGQDRANIAAVSSPFEVMALAGVPNDVRQVATQQTTAASVPRFLEEISRGSALHGTLQQANLQIGAINSHIQGGGGQFNLGQIAPITPQGVYGNIGSAMNTAALFLDPGFQQQQASQIATSQMNHLTASANALAANTDGPGAVAGAVDMRMAYDAARNPVSGSPLAPFGHQYASPNNAIFSDRAAMHSHLTSRNLQSIQATIAPIADEFAALPADEQAAARSGVRTMATTSIMAARGIGNVPQLISDVHPGAAGVQTITDQEGRLSGTFNDVAQTLAGAYPDAPSQVVHPGAADPFRVVGAGHVRDVLKRGTGAAVFPAGRAISGHMAGESGAVEVLPPDGGGGSGGIIPPGGGGTGGPGGTGGSGGMGGNNSDLIAAIKALAAELRSNTTAQQNASRQLGHDASVLSATAQGGVAHDPTGRTSGFIQPGFAPQTDAQGNPIGSRFQRMQRGFTGGLIAGLTGSQATANDGDRRRVGKGVGRGLGQVVKLGGKAIALGSKIGLGSAQLGDDLQGTLNSIPGFGRGFEGLGTFANFAQLAVQGELPALQATSQLMGADASGNLLTQQLGGNMKVGAGFGLSMEQMGGLFLPMIQSAGGGMQATDIGKFTRGFAAGEDVGGIASLMGQQRMAGITTGRATEFNAARGLGLRGSAATGFASNLFGAFRGISAGSGIAHDRVRTEQRILGMGGGDIEAGTARFQRGAGVHQGAIDMLFADMNGVAETLLMAEAMQRADGDRLKAKRLMEADKAQGGAMLHTRLGALGFDSETRQEILGGRLTTQDHGMMHKRGAVASSESFDLIEANAGKATRTSGAFGTRRNEQIDTFLSPRGQATFDTIMEQEKKVEQVLVDSLNKNVGQLDKLTDVIIILNKALTQFVKQGNYLQSGRNDVVDKIQSGNTTGAVVSLLNYLGWMTYAGIR